MKKIFSKPKYVSSFPQRMFITFLLAFITLAVITGCQTKENGSVDYFTETICSPSPEENLTDYLNENIHADYEIISGPIADKDSDSTNIWTIKANDPAFPEPVVFHVYQTKTFDGDYFDRYHSENNFGNEALKQVFKKYHGWTDDFYIEKHGNGDQFIVCNIYKRDDFLTAADEIARFAVFLKKNYPKLHAYVCYQMKYMDFHPGIFSNKGRDYFFNCYDIPPDLEKELNTDILKRDYSAFYFIREIKSAESERLHLLMKYGIIDKMEEYSKDEKNQNLQIKDDKIYLEKQDHPASDTGYICADDKMGYGTLFYILNEYGYDVNGTWDKFSFTGKDGEEYSFDYADCDYDKDEPLVNASMIKRATGIPFEKKKSGEENIWFMSM